MSGRTISWILYAFLLVNGSGEIAAADDAKAIKRSNIVVMLVDNVGWGDIGVYGGGILRGAPTPRLDRLAEEGMRLLNFNVEPFCVPSRSALMTGRFSIRTGTSDASAIRALPRSEITIANLLSEEGYATAIFGKWHLGGDEGSFPTDRGFDKWYGIPESSATAMWSDAWQHDDDLAPLQPVLESKKGERPKQVKPYDSIARRTLDGELVQHSIAFMADSVRKEAPFFLYLSFTQTHMPTLPHPDFAGATGNGDYADALAELDYRAGQVLDAIEQLGITRNTIVIWTSDNGPSAEYPHGTAGYWRGRVGQALEGSIRTPFLIRWPGEVVAGSVNNEIVHIVDLLPSLARVAGYDLPDDRFIDGVDQLAFLTGKQARSNRDGFPIYGAGGKLYAYKWSNWKLHFIKYEEQNWRTSPHVYLYPNSALPGIYNLLVDPKEEYPMGPESLWVGKVIGKRVAEFTSTISSSP